MTREEAKVQILKDFDEGVIECEALKNFVAGFPDDYEPFDDELYEMIRELGAEGKLVIYTFNVPSEEEPVEVLFPKGSSLMYAGSAPKADNY